MYTVTSQEAAEYNCPAPGNESGEEKGASLGTRPRMVQKGSVLQCTGRLCGYDSWFELAAPFAELEFDTRRKKKGKRNLIAATHFWVCDMLSRFAEIH